MIQYFNMIGIMEISILVIIFVIIATIILVIPKRQNDDVEVEDTPQKDIQTIKEKQNDDSLGIIKERLAKGEISKKEYDELKKEFE